MSIDTVAKRFSAVNVGSPWRGINAFPDGGGTLGDESGNPIGDEGGTLIGDDTISEVNRFALAYLYSGFFIGNAFTLEALSGSFTMTGRDATLTPTTHIFDAQDRFAAMNIGNVWRGLNLFPTGVIGKTGRSVLANFYVPFVTGPTYEIVCTAGSFIWDGEPSFSDFEIAAHAGTFSMTGNDATFIATRTLYATAGVFTMTGNDANLTYFVTRTLVGLPGSFVMTGSDATFQRACTLVAESGVFDLVGYPAVFTWLDENGTPVVTTVEQPTGGWFDYGYAKPRKKKKKEPEAITTAKEIVEILEKPRKAPKPKETDEERRKREEELLLLG